MKPLFQQRPWMTLSAAALMVWTLQGCVPLVVGAATTTVIVASDRRTSGIQLEDERIELRGNGAMRENLGEQAHVSVNSFDRQVLLTGEVPTAQDKARAEQIARQIENVRSVINELAVMPPSSFSSRSNDVVISGKVKASIVDARDLTVHAFDIVTERGVVYLMGKVTQRELNRVTEVVRGVSGVERVVRVMEVISEDELARMQPKPAPNSTPAGDQAPN